MSFRGRNDISDVVAVARGRFRSLSTWHIFIAVIVLLGMPGAIFAQEAPPPTHPSPSPAAQPPPGQAPADQTNAVPPKPVVIFNLLQKKSIVFPDIAYSTERLSTEQKFKLFIDNSVSVDQWTWSLLGSAVGQAANSPSGFEQGWAAYGKRFGASMARGTSTQFFGTFMLASALHEDPRFYAEVNPRFLHAMKYSLQRVIISRSDDGRDILSWSKLCGPMLAEGLATVYYPDRNRTVGETFLRYGIDLASRASGNMFREYWPILLKKISRPPKAAHK